jgi:hypothetical protein
MLIGIFNSTQESKERIIWKKIEPKQWDRIICMWTEQTSYEYDWKNWLNINWIYIVWNQWIPWKDGKPWKDTDPVDEKLLLIQLYERLKHDESFQQRIAGKPWKDWAPWKKWEDASCDINYIIEKLIPKLIDNKYFVEKCKAKDWLPWKPWKDWEDGKPWKDAKPWKDGEDAIDGNNWSIIHVIPEYKEWKRDKIDICIDYKRNIYYRENNSVKMIPFTI